MDPLQLLTNSEMREQSFLGKYWIPGVASTLGVVAACIVNFGTRRPVFSGIQKHAVGGIVGWVLGSYGDDYRNQYLAQKDALLRHYIELHRDDFPAPERKKFKEVLEPWIPVR